MLMSCRIVGSILLTVSITGCASWRKDLGEFRSDVVLREAPKTVDLLRLLSSSPPPASTSTLAMSDQEYLVALDDAYGGFTKAFPDAKLAVERRNLILDRIVEASNESCERFKADLLHRQARENFLLGTFATIAGGAGAVVRSAKAASNYAAAAGVSSGIRAEFNQQFFADKAAQVLTAAIDRARADMKVMFESAKARPLSEYSVVAAVADGVQFNGACSIAGAFNYTANAIAQIDVQKGLKNSNADILERVRPLLNGEVLKPMGAKPTDKAASMPEAAASSTTN